MDFERHLNMLGIPFKDNSQKGRIEIGNLTFIYQQMSDPGDIYAHNFMGALVDELDELPPEKVLPVVEAIQERCRKMVPAGKTIPARGPFMVFTTTAQGLGGTYLFFERLKKQNKEALALGKPKPVPFAIVHARTIDNPHLDPKQVERLRALYTPEEAQAYLEGKFVNLSTGRVWPSFDRRRNVCMRFPVDPTETIYVGQDFNCIAQGTLIATDRGLIPIEKLDTSYSVLTRKGYKKVLSLLDKGIQECGNYNNLVATSDHVAITEGGDICLKKAKSLLTIPLPALKRAAEAEQLLSFLEKGIRLSVGTTQHNMWTVPIKCYIAQSGNILTALYQMDMRSIISMVIQSITGWRTSPQFLGKSIEEFITMMSRQPIIQTLQESYTDWLATMRGLRDVIKCINRVQSADTNTSLPQLPACTALNVDKLCVDGIIKTDNLTTAVGNVNVLVLNAVALLRELSALSTVLSIQSTGNVKRGATSTVNVYDLMIEGAHEFFAGGVLVHNCNINASAEGICRGNRIYIIGSHHWKEMGEAPRTLRQLYPTNPIVMIPDASGKEIMQGYVEECEQHNIQIYWNNKNPSITERVMAGNMLMRTDRCFVMEDDGMHGDVDNAILALETHDVDEKTGKPRKGAGIQAPDHFSDSFGYLIWRVIFGVKGFDDIIEALQCSHQAM